jgi:iron complex outermembrane recepter protein
MTTQRDARYTAAVIPTGILAVLAQVAGEEGVKVDPWLTGLGITRAQIDDAGIRVSYRQASLIIKRALRAIPCSDIGLKVGTHQSIGSFGIMGLAMMTARTFGEAIATRGYQAGGYNFDLPGSHYEPETVWNYEGGIKSYFPDHRLLLNASVYYYKYSNLQTLNLVSNGNGNLPAYQVTISDQHAKGLDLETHWQATDALRVGVAAAYIDSTYRDYIASDGANLAGQPTGEPLWSSAVGLDYVVRHIAGGSLDFTLQDAYRGKYRCNADSVVQGNCLATPTFRLGTAQNRTDLRIGWTSPDVPCSVALYSNNLFDKRYVTGISNISATTLGAPFASISAPRFWGVEVAAHF